MTYEKIKSDGCRSVSYTHLDVYKRQVNQILEDPGNEMLIARGITPEKGTDGRIDYLFYPKEEKEDPNDINKRVDYKNVNEIPSVKKGDLLVVKTPPLYGKNGTNIYGKTIKPPNPKNPRFLPGNNVRVDEEGLKAYSLVDGKPVVRGKVLHVFSVHEEMCIRDRYGNYLGMAFQIKDDILDFIGNQEKVGKPLGSDIKNGIYTLPVIYALKKGGRSKELRQILEKGSFTHEDVSKIIQMVTEDGGVDFANNLLLKYILKAKRCV